MSVAWGLIIGIKNVLELPGEEGEGGVRVWILLVHTIYVFLYIRT